MTMRIPTAGQGERVRYRHLANPSVDTRRCVSSGFTLVELLVTLGILGILVAIAVPQYASWRENAKMEVAANEIRTLSAEIANAAYRGDYPASLADIGRAGAVDPWGNPYVYAPVESTPGGQLRKDRFLVPLNTDFDLYSSGPDGDSQPPLTSSSSRDDIVRANDGAFIGPASEY